MQTVRRTILEKALFPHLPAKRVYEILNILEPLFQMSANEHFLYGNELCFPSMVHTSIQLLTNRPCAGTECVAESDVPRRFLLTPQKTNFTERMRFHLKDRLDTASSGIIAKDFRFDLRTSFGNRLIQALPKNLWCQLWETVHFWLLCEIAGEPFKREAAALEQVVRLLRSGYIVFDFKVNEPTIALIVSARQAPAGQRYRWR